MKRKDKTETETCSAKNCPSAETNGDGIKLFPFPRKQSLRRQWLDNANLQGVPQKNTTRFDSYQLCSRHFDDNQFCSDTKAGLKENAIPTIFDSISATVSASSPSSRSMKETNGNKKSVEELKDDSDATESAVRVNSNTPGQTSQKSGQVPENTHCQWCSAINCSNSRNRRPDLSFFRFPLQPERCKKWIINSQRFDLESKSCKTLHNGSYMMCSEHFESKCIVMSENLTIRRRLHNWAVPTIFNFLPSVKKTKKPTPAFPSSYALGKEINGEKKHAMEHEAEATCKSGGKRRTRSLKRKHPATDEQQAIKPDEGSSSEPASSSTVEVLRKENIALSEKLHALSESRLGVMKRLTELEDTFGTFQEHARIDVGLLERTVDTSKDGRAQREFERLKLLIRLLTDPEEVDNKNEGEHDSLD